VLPRQGFHIGAGALAILPQVSSLPTSSRENPRSRERLMNARVCRSSSL
jgi:hypothetical protein